ncbi:kinase-like protein [Hyphopichia burtonii NRRL Y-1933]|uniref:non-specific serine/threonine protein kinase n=1 Tax=Hyphopichia burtonii NRRL Y-1933 TaxID=984485 RepID=A0A1E4RF52_9ASCO|nr:kinase-like protein [Hyphopichia burtonii NRRL Y-1933]ODV65888.1 kinase-like protein [Hyphopichia burtonii NRRL Y-1933]
MQPPSFNGNIASIDHVVGIDYTKLNSKPIYEGANGVVFKGTNRNQRDILVIKTIKKQANHSNDNYSALVFKEYNNVKQCLGCKQIINVLDLAVNEEANEVSLIIPYYPRGDLLDYLSQLRKNKIELTSNLKDAVFKQIVKGVNFLHERNIVHRDLKPENCLIDEDGTIRLSDFGYTLDLNKIDEQIKLNDICCGTTSFKAPELFDYERLIDSENYLGYLEKIDFKALDCWSLGIFYFQIYLMRVPWNDADLKNDSSNKTYHKYAKHYPSDENLLNSLINQLDDKNFNMQYNPALAIFKKLHHESRYFIFSLLNPQPDKRLDANSLLNSNWLNQVYANSKDFIELLPNKKR